MPNLEIGLPYDGAKAYFLFSDIDYRDVLSTFVLATYEEIPMSKPKRKRRKRYQGTCQIEGYYPYVVPPLEWPWWKSGYDGMDYSYVV